VRAFLTLCLVLVLAGVHAPVAAQDLQVLRRELEQVRERFEAMKDQSQKAIGALSDRIQQLEAERPAVTQPAAAPPPAPGQPSWLDLARPREPFALSERRGPGQLLFDMGAVGDLVGTLVQRNVEKAQAGSFAGRENRVFPREIELLLYGQIDPYARGEVRLEAAEEFEDGARRLEASLAEAHLTLLTLPFGTQFKMGLMRTRFGLLNHVHREALPQPDVPNVLTRFLGEEGLAESGVEASWVPPLPFYLEALVGAFNGDNETAFGRASLKAPLVTGRLRTFLEVGDLGAVQLGVSAGSGETAERRRSTLAAADIKYKLTPEGWRHPLVTLAGEAVYSNRRLDVSGDPDGDGADTGEDRTRKRFGWYAYGEVQPWKRWAGGLRYDWTQFPVDPGHEWAVEPYLAFMPSDFLRFRLAYKHTDRSHRVSGPDDRGSARILDELLFQATFFLGAHAPHPF
jgi:hypothetical protein